MKRKVFGILFALVLSFSLVMAVPAAAAVSEVWVDDDAPSGWYDATHLHTIQEGIDAVASSTVHVAAGTYNENVNVNKSLTLQGVSSATVTVTAANPAVSVFTVTASNVNISGFTATGTTMTGNEGYAGIKFGSGVTNCNIHDNILSVNQYGILLIEPENTTTPGNNTFTSNTASDCVVSGIEMQHSYGNTFTNNIANSNTKYGFKLDSARHNTFTGNTANLNQKGFYLTTGQGDGSNDNTFTNNTANLNTRYGFAVGGLSSGTILTGNTFDNNAISGVRLEDTVTTLNMQNNNITNNPTGIDIQASVTDVTTWTVSYNNIAGNTNYGVSNAGTGTLNATNNWWGDASGPYHPTTNPGGTGDTVSDNVDYDPWLTAAVAAAKSGTTETDPDTVDATTEADVEVIKSGTGTPTITVVKYEDNPGTGFSGDIGKYIDVHIDDTTNVDEVEIRLYYTDDEIEGLSESSLRLYWWDGTDWEECSDSGVETETEEPGYSGYIWARITDDTTPSLDDLAGTPFGGSGSPRIVGGTVYPVDKVSILMPWIGLAVALALAGVFAARLARRRVRG